MDLILKVRNQVSTLADRSGAGRGAIHERRRARGGRRPQDGLGGRVLQRNSSAIRCPRWNTRPTKREFITAGLGASFCSCGSRSWPRGHCRFDARHALPHEVHARAVGGRHRCSRDGTWAYTADGIIRFMHAYKLEAMIPIAIGVFGSQTPTFTCARRNPADKRVVRRHAVDNQCRPARQVRHRGEVTMDDVTCRGTRGPRQAMLAARHRDRIRPCERGTYDDEGGRPSSDSP